MPLDVSVGVATGLVDEVEIAEFESARWSAGETDRCSVSDEGFAGLVDAIEQRDEALFFGLWDSFAHSHTDDVPCANQAFYSAGL